MNWRHITTESSFQKRKLHERAPRSQMEVESHGRPWLLADTPGLADFATYHGLWFLGALAIDCSHELDVYPATRAWRNERHSSELRGTSERTAMREASGLRPQATGF